MNEQDLINRRTQDSNLREAINRKEQHRAHKPADLDSRLMERVMSSLPDRDTVHMPRRARRVSMRWWISAAACLLLIFSIGTMLFFDDGSMQLQPVLVQNNKSTNDMNLKNITTAPAEQTYCTDSTKQLHQKQRIKEPSVMADLATETHESDDLKSIPHQHLVANLSPSTLSLPPSPIHAVLSDSVSYQDPARVDVFIAKMADYYKAGTPEQVCSVPMDSNIVSTVYIFPDKKEIDLFSRLLQVACWFSDDTPGYFLNFSHQQFFFELKDMRKQLYYRWIAERVNGKILLYSTCSPLEIIVSSACFQEYRDELMHIKSLNPKTLDI